MKINANSCSDFYDISFIIPVYNAETFLTKCIDSLLEQKDITNEIILVDDGSDDQSLKICRKYCSQYENINVIEQQHVGASVARNTGIKSAKGTWISFVDSDDWIESDCLSRILNVTDHNDQICFMNFSKVKNNNIRQFIYSKSEVIEFNKEDFEKLQTGVLNKNKAPDNLSITTPWAKLYRREFLLTNNLYFTPGIRKSQDVLFNFQAYQYAEHGKYINCQMYYYRYNEQSLCNKYMPNIIEDYQKQLLIMDRLLTSFQKKENLLEDYYTRTVIYFINALLLDYLHKDNILTHNQRKKEFLKAINEKPFYEAFKYIERKPFKAAERIAIWCIQNRFFTLLAFMNLFYKS